MSCCCRPRAAWKQRVDAIFPATGRADGNAVSSLLYYANANSDKLPRICNRIERHTKADITRKRYTSAENGAFMFNELVKSCHRDLSLFYTPLSNTLTALLSSEHGELRRAGAELFVTFANAPVGNTMCDVDAVVAAFLDMANSQAKDQTVCQQQRVAGLRGLHAYFSLLDEHLSRLSAAGPRINPTVFDNLRYDHDPVPLQPTWLASASEGIGNEEQQSVRGLARLCLCDVAERTATIDVKGFVQEVLDYIDEHDLWLSPTADRDTSFAADLLKSVCDALKPHDYQTALDCVVNHLVACARKSSKDGNLKRQTKMAETLTACVRRGMLTVHHLVRDMLELVLQSFNAKKDSKTHQALRTAMIECVVQVGVSVQPSKRLDTLEGIARQIKMLHEQPLKNAAQRPACMALLTRAFADVAGKLIDVSDSDSTRVDRFYDTLLSLVVKGMPMQAETREQWSVALLDALTALVAVAPARTDADDDITGERYILTAADVGSEGADDITPKKRRGRLNTNFATLPVSTYVERHARILQVVDQVLFPASSAKGGDNTGALSSVVAAAGRFLLGALDKYTTGEALRTLPYVFHLQAVATALPDSMPRVKKATECCDPSALMEVVGAYMRTLGEQCDSDELRATVTHTLEQRIKKKQASPFVRMGSSRTLEFVAPLKKDLRKPVKRIDVSFERASIVAMLQRSKKFKHFGHLAARLGVTWAAPVKGQLPHVREPSSRMSWSRFNDSEQPSARTSPRDDPMVLDTFVLDEHAEPTTGPKVDVAVTAASFLAVLRGEERVDDDSQDPEADVDVLMDLSDSDKSEISLDETPRKKSKKKGKRHRGKSKTPLSPEEEARERIKDLRARSFQEMVQAGTERRAADAALVALVQGKTSAHVLTELPNVLNTIDASSRVTNDGKGALPRIRDEFAGGSLVVRRKRE